MKYVFKSTINCGNCKASVAPHLDGEESITSWSVDLEHPDRLLTVETDGLDDEQVIRLVRGAGYKLELQAAGGESVQTNEG
jgi:copper chaperone